MSKRLCLDLIKTNPLLWLKLLAILSFCSSLYLLPATLKRLLGVIGSRSFVLEVMADLRYGSQIIVYLLVAGMQVTMTSLLNLSCVK